MIVNVVFLQNSAPIVVEVDAHLLAAVDAIVTENWLATSGDPDTSQRIRVYLIALNQSNTIVMLWGKTNTNYIATDDCELSYKPILTEQQMFKGC